jgi:hypothetical protein
VAVPSAGVHNGGMAESRGDVSWRLGGLVRPGARRFAEVVCPPQVLEGDRTERVLREFELMLGALQPAARRAIATALVLIDQGARLYPRSRGRRLARLDDRAAHAYLRTLLGWRGVAAEMARRLKSMVVIGYYELPEARREIGYDPDPYIAAVSRRRLKSYGSHIRAAEAAVTGPAEPAP